MVRSDQTARKRRLQLPCGGDGAQIPGAVLGIGSIYSGFAGWVYTPAAIRISSAPYPITLLPCLTHTGESMSDESHAVAIPTPMGSMVPDWWAKAYGPLTMYKTTLDAGDPKQRAVLLASLNEDGEPATSAINTDLPLIGYTISPASRVVDGEIQEWVRCVLHTADGRNVVCGSMGIIRSLMLIEQLDRRAPWQPQLVKRLISKPLKDGKHWYSLIDPPPARKPGTKA